MHTTVQPGLSAAAPPTHGRECALDRPALQSGLRARIFLDHRRLYEPDVLAWARRVTSPAWSVDGKLRSPRRRLLACLGYLALIRRYYPSPVRPLFWRPPIPRQRRLRALARLAGLQQ